MAEQESIHIRFIAHVAELQKGLSKAQKSLSRFGTSAFFLGSRITAGIGIPIALLTKAVVGVGAAFDQAMTESLAIMDRKGQQMRSQMESVAKSIALTTKFSAEEAAQAYFFLASSGMNAAESMRALPVAANFAQAGVISLEKATELLSDAYITLGMRSKDPIQNMKNMQRVADVLTEANNRAQGTIEEFALALTNRAGVAFRTFGISVETGVAALAAFAERGIKGRTAGRQLFIVIRDLQRAVLKNNKEWTALVGPGAIFELASGQFRNIADIMGTLEGSLEGLADDTKKAKLQMLGFQERSLQATLALMGASGRIRELEGHLKKAGGVTQRVAEKQMRSFTNQLGLVSERLKQVGIDLFDAFRSTIEGFVIPAANNLIDTLKDLSHWIKMLDPGTRALIVSFLGLGAALGPVVAGFGSLSLVLIPIIGLLKPLSYVFALVGKGMLKWTGLMETAGAVATGASLGIDGFRKVIVRVGKWILRFLGPLGTLVTVLFTAWGLWKKLGSTTEKYTSSLSDLSQQVGISTLRFKELVAEYEELFHHGAKNEDQLNRLAHAEEMLASAVGMTVDQFRAEAESGTHLIDTLTRMSDARLEDGKVRLAEHRESKKQLQEEIRLIKERLSEVRRSIDAGVGGYTSFLAVTGVSPGEEGGKEREDILITEGLSQKLIRTNDELTRSYIELSRQLGITETEIGVLSRETDSLNEMEKVGIEIAEEVTRSQADLAEQLRLTALANDAYTEKVIKLADELAGFAGDEMKLLQDAFQMNTDAGLVDAAMLQRLWAAYKKLREQLDPSEFPQDLENATRGLRETEEALDFTTTATGRFIQSMKGIDKDFEHFIENQDAIVKSFEELNGEMDPRFFKQHGKTIETLAEHYGDRLHPVMKKIIEIYEEWKRASEETTEDVVEDQSKASAAIIKASDRMTASMMDKKAELAAFSLSTQDAELVGLKKGYNSMRQRHAETIAGMIVNVTEMSEAERHAGTMRVVAAQEDSKEMLSAEKRIGLLRVLSALDVDDRILRNHEDFVDAWLEEEIKRLELARDAWEDYHRRVSAMSAAAGLFSELAKAIPALEGIGSSLSGIASAAGAWATNAEKWADPAAKAFEKVTAGIGMATAAMAAFNAISQMKTRGGRTAAGAMAGAQMGSAFGPVGSAVGAGIGAIAGAVMGDPGWVKIQNAISTMWQTSVTDELAKAIEETSKEVGSDWGAMLLHLNEVIEESGGVTEKNVGKWAAEVRDAFSLMDMGIFTSAEAAEVLDENFGALAKAGTQLSGVLRADVFELILLDEQFGTASEAIKEFKEEMMDLALTGLATFAAGSSIIREGLEEAFAERIEQAKEAHDLEINNQVELAQKAGATQDEIDAIRTRGAVHWEATLKAMNTQFKEDFLDKTFAGFQELNDFTELTFLAMKDGGTSFLDALDALEPSLAELQKHLDITGEVGSDAIMQLLRIREFKNENEGLILQIQGMNDLMVGLANSGNMSEQSFTKFGEAANRQFAELTKRGLESDEALMLMAPTLMALRDAAENYGFAIDENTQALIDQATEKGLLGEKAKTIDEQMLDGVNLIVEMMGTLVTLFGGTLPQAMQEAADAAARKAEETEQSYDTATDHIQADFDSLHLPDLDKEVKVQVRWRIPDFDPKDHLGGHDFRGFQHGGIINKPTLAMMGEGGESELIGPVGFMSKALEGALSKTGPSEVEREMLEELHGLRSDLKTLPLHLRDALILTG